jgi:hypothetical protein
VGISVGEQNIDEQAPGKLLCVCQRLARELVENFGDLLVVGAPVFVMRIAKTRSSFSITALATSERRRPPLEKAKRRRARSRMPIKPSVQVASIASSASLVSAALLAGRTPRVA